MTQTPLEGEVTGRRNAPPLALSGLVACLITIIVIDLLVRALVEGVVSQNAPTWPYNPAVSRIAGMIASRLTEVWAVLLALALLFRITRYGSFADLGLARPGARWLPVGLLIPMLGLVIGALVANATGLLSIERLLYPGPWPTALALAAATQAAWIEELTFRGVIMQGAERFAGAGRRSRIIGILISGALYTILHLFAPFTLTWAWWVIVAIAGLSFGWAFYSARRNLWLTIGLHWGFDLGVFWLLGLPGESKGWLHARAFGPTPALSQSGGFVMLIGAFLTVLVMILLLQKGWNEEAA